MGKPQTAKSCGSWMRIKLSPWVYIPVIVVVFMLLFLGVAGAQFATHIIFGWIFHLAAISSNVSKKVDGVVFPLVCTIVFLIFCHRFILWCIRTKQVKRPWSASHTVISTCILLLFCSAAIAMSGVVHQLAWLSSSRILEDTRRTQILSDINHAKQLGLLLDEYQQHKGHYPHSLHDLFRDESVNPEFMLSDNLEFELGEPFLLLAPGAKELPDDHLLLASPHIHKRGTKLPVIVVLQADMSVKLMPDAKYQEQLERQRRETP